MPRRSPSDDALEPACRLYVILARDGRSAVVFRRGPSKQVLVLRWWLGDDRLVRGQWFRGRIYERRCDLSPDGDLLIYFAASWKAPYQTWTAISRTPYLTALALWPKGDAWGGGGVFNAARVIGLNHLSVTSAIIPGVKQKWHPLGPETPSAGLPAPYTAERWSEYAGRGEDNPVCDHRMMRDGWVKVAEGDAGPHRSSDFAWLFNSPEIYERKSPGDHLVLRRYLNAIYQKNGPWYVEDFEVCGPDGNRLRMLENCSWADWQDNGDLLFAIGGKLYRLSGARAQLAAQDALQDAALIADLAPLRFENAIAPDWAQRWP